MAIGVRSQPSSLDPFRRFQVGYLSAIWFQLYMYAKEVMLMTDKRSFYFSTAILKALVLCLVLQIHKVVFAQVSSVYCSAKDAVWLKGYFEAQIDSKNSGPYDVTLRAVVPTDDYANGYAQGWSDASAGLIASRYKR